MHNEKGGPLHRTAGWADRPAELLPNFA